MNSPKLHYAFMTVPSPLQVSPPSGALSVATLKIEANNLNPATPVTVKAIGIEILVKTSARDEAAAFADNGTGITVIPDPNWQLKTSRFDGGRLAYLFTPKSGSAVAVGGETLKFSIGNIPISRAVGSTHFTVKEDAVDGMGVKVIDFTKWPPKIGAIDFYADPIIIYPGDGTTLHWNGVQGATYTIQYLDGNGNPVHYPETGNLPSTGQYPEPGKPSLVLNHPTSFTLNVDYTDEQQARHQIQKQILITIANPSKMNVRFSLNPSAISTSPVLSIDIYPKPDTVQLSINGSSLLNIPNQSTSKSKFSYQDQYENLTDVKLKKDAENLLTLRFNYGSATHEMLYMTDSRDGKVYRIIKAEGKLWMAENLAFDPGHDSWIYENNASYGAKYGRLYTWEAAVKACPPGWRLPTRKEWQTLAESFGGESISEKEVSLTDYDALTDKGSSGFDALLSGEYNSQEQKFYLVGLMGFYWTNDDVGLGEKTIVVFEAGKGMGISGDFPALGYACRCVKDA